MILQKRLKVKSRLTNLIWNCVSPKARQYIAENTDESQLRLFYSDLDLDNKVEFLSYKD